MSEGNISDGRPMVRIRRTPRRWLKHFFCDHFYIWCHPGDGRTPWKVCLFCEWTKVDPCDAKGHNWERFDHEGKHWFVCTRCEIPRVCRICGPDYSEILWNYIPTSRRR